MGRALVTQNCWHNQPVFSFIVSVLPGLDSTSYLTALVFVAEVSRRSWGGMKLRPLHQFSHVSFQRVGTWVPSH